MSSQGFSDPPSPPKGSKRVPGWVPFAAFAGTTVALAIPLVFLARQRNSVLRTALKESSAPPPRRSGAAMSGRLGAKPNSSMQTTVAESSAVEHSSPGTGELLSAISKVDFSTAIYAGKAFGIATGLVTVGAVALTLGVKAVMGVEDTKEFAQRVRLAIWRRLPGLTSKIHRPPEVDDEGVPISESHEPDLEWSWEDAEKRLQAAYDEGGFPAWVQAAMHELEAELKVERARRQKEYESASEDKVLS